MSDHELLFSLGIVNAKSFRQWALLNHPDKGGEHDFFVLVREAFEYVSSDNSFYKPYDYEDEDLCFAFQNLCAFTAHSRYCECTTLNTDPNSKEKTRQCSQLKYGGGSYCKFHQQFQF